MGRKLKVGERILLSGHEHIVEDVSDFGARVRPTGKQKVSFEVLEGKVQFDRRYTATIISARPDLKPTDYLGEGDSSPVEVLKRKRGRPKGSKNKPREIVRKRRAKK